MKLIKALPALALLGTALALPNASPAAALPVFVGITVAPPVLPVYVQPEAPGDGYIWTPGYWAWDPEVSDYYWVPGTWVLAPQPGYLWTPGYWGFENSVYLWHAGYWGPHIGFYGGVNYGYGYFGLGYEGGYWRSGHFFYNTTYSHVNVTVIHNTYVHNVTVVNNTRVAYNGGPNGLAARPSAGEQAAFHENHVQPTTAQLQHASLARQDRTQFASANHGQPPAAAMAHPAENANSFHGNNVSAARPAPANGGRPEPGGMNNNTSRGGFGGNNGAQPANRPGGAQPAERNGFANNPGASPASRPTPTPGAQPTARPAAPAVAPHAAPAPAARPAPAAHPAPASHGGGGHR